MPRLNTNIQTWLEIIRRISISASMLGVISPFADLAASKEGVAALQP
jgi:hypothetical protein